MSGGELEGVEPEAILPSVTPSRAREILDHALEAAHGFRRMSKLAMQALLAKTKSVAIDGEFEPFKTSSIFDSTASNPDWLGEEPRHIRELMPA